MDDGRSVRGRPHLNMDSVLRSQGGDFRKSWTQSYRSARGNPECNFSLEIEHFWPYNTRERFPFSRWEIAESPDDTTSDNLSGMVSRLMTRKSGWWTCSWYDGGRNVGNDGHDRIKIEQNEGLGQKWVTKLTRWVEILWPLLVHSQGSCRIANIGTALRELNKANLRDDEVNQSVLEDKLSQLGMRITGSWRHEQFYCRKC